MVSAMNERDIEAAFLLKRNGYKSLDELISIVGKACKVLVIPQGGIGIPERYIIMDA